MKLSGTKGEVPAASVGLDPEHSPGPDAYPLWSLSLLRFKEQKAGDRMAALQMWARGPEGGSLELAITQPAGSGQAAQVPSSLKHTESPTHFAVLMES